MTVANDGEHHLFLTLDGEQPVIPTVAIVGQIYCAACDTAWQHTAMLDLTDLTYARDYVQARTTWAALFHANSHATKGYSDV